MKKIIKSNRKINHYIKLGGICLLFLIFAIIFFAPVFFNKDKIKLKSASSVKSNSSQIEINNSVIRGINNRDNKFSIFANKINKKNNGETDLIDIKAEFKVSKSNRLLSFISKFAKIDEKKQLFSFLQNVVFKYQDLKILSNKLSVSFKNNKLSSTDKIKFESTKFNFFAENGFKTDKIDFTSINFGGPILLSFAKSYNNGKLECNKMKLYFFRQPKVLNKAVAYGKVKFIADGYNITSKEATLDNIKNILIIKDGILNNIQGKVKIEEFHYDTLRGIGSIKQNANSRSQIILER